MYPEYLYLLLKRQRRQTLLSISLLPRADWITYSNASVRPSHSLILLRASSPAELTFLQGNSKGHYPHSSLPCLKPSPSSHTDKTHVFLLPLVRSEVWIMETAANELRKCNAEGNKWKTSGPPQDGAEWPSSMRPPAWGDSWPTKFGEGLIISFLPSFPPSLLLKICICTYKSGFQKSRGFNKYIS